MGPGIEIATALAKTVHDHSRDKAALVARLPGIRVLQCGLGLVLVLDQLQSVVPK